MGTETRIEAPIEERLRLDDIVMEFGRRRVLDAVSLRVLSGEIHGIVGQNGSGKSTITKILAGAYNPSQGRIRVDGVELSTPTSPTDLLRHGVTFVHQDLGLVDELTVVENVAISRIPSSRFFRRILTRQQKIEVQAVLDLLGSGIDARSRVGTLSPAERATVAIARAIFAQGERAGLLVLDEATRSLPLTGLNVVHDIIKRIAARGGSVLMISHNLEEVLSLTDRVTVLRDGVIAAAGLLTSSVTTNDIAHQMLGEAADLTIDKSRGPDPAGERIVVTGLSGGFVHDVDLELGHGEVVGVTGLEGSGFEHLPYLLTGARRATSGVLTLGDRQLDLPDLTIAMALDLHFALVPERRLADGVASGESVRDNIVLPRLGENSTRWRIDRAWVRRESDHLHEQFDIRPGNPKLLVRQLSGGNQQKVLLAKWFSCRPRLAVLHEPTQAVDVGARADILRAVRDAASAGAAVLVASLDVNDLVAVCDRVLVLRDGTINGEFPADDAAPIIHAIYGEDPGTTEAGTQTGADAVHRKEFAS